MERIKLRKTILPPSVYDRAVEVYGREYVERLYIRQAKLPKWGDDVSIWTHPQKGARHD